MTRAASVIALAIGDPNGIGPEIAVKAAARLATQDAPRIVLVGDAHVIRWYAQRCALSFDALHVLDVKALPADSFKPGEVSAAAGAATLAYVRAALDLARREEADAVIACPHSETAINASGTAFAGYPGYVARHLGLAADDVYLLLIGGGLRIVHATLHEGLAGALARLTSKQVEGAARAAVRAMNAMGIDKPRIGVMGINPHAGEGGLFGREDIDVTEPAVATLRDEGIDVVGPQGADLLLTREDIDVFVAMYHDQGHIPVKLRAGRHSAAMSIGGDVVFSSVGHGSGFDIAGRLVADPAPLLGAIGLVTRGESPA
ncbi:PdxA family dehydrogenase [Caballeronia cordobensis]|uniref:PdxA family dehydrogenase n=1 Tax=Caballeronia cordobensis TaxID=1353886 RepID=UPI00045F0A37|nr:4-hydroxythreonine-4-phosphate dehydrogenase [Burkholderia sp. RPE67]